MKHHHTNIYKAEGLYLVVFIDEGGVYEGNTRYYYLTDSTNFTKYLGSADDKESYYLRMDGNNAVVEKHSRRNKGKHAESIIGKTIYNISDLKNNGEYDD